MNYFLKFFIDQESSIQCYCSDQHCTGTEYYRYSNGQRFSVFWFIRGNKRIYIYTVQMNCERWPVNRLHGWNAIFLLCVNRKWLRKGVIYEYLCVITSQRKPFVNCELRWIVQEFYAYITTNWKGTLRVNTRIYA